MSLKKVINKIKNDFAKYYDDINYLDSYILEVCVSMKTGFCEFNIHNLDKNFDDNFYKSINNQWFLDGIKMNEPCNICYGEDLLRWHVCINCNNCVCNGCTIKINKCPFCRCMFDIEESYDIEKIYRDGDEDFVMTEICFWYMNFKDEHKKKYRKVLHEMWRAYIWYMNNYNHVKSNLFLQSIRDVNRD